MTTKICTLLVAAILLSSISFAKIFRVGYNGLALTGVDYDDLQQAHNAAAAGDTIQIYTSSATSGIINKKLVIIGYGYNFDVNTNLQAIGTDAPSRANITFAAGSDGSIVSGVSGTFAVGQVGTTPISNISFQRCNGVFNFLNYINYGAISNIKITSCVVHGVQFYSSAPSSNPVTNLQIYNCIIGGIISLQDPGTTAIIENCVSASGASVLYLSDAGVVVKNCILGSAQTTTNINTIFESNFFGEAQPATLPAGSNNRWSQDWGVLFNRLGGTDNAPGNPGTVAFNENYYILKSGSPAINGGFDAANNPTNCGIYGGEAAYIYKLSGVPAVPAIYKLTAPGTAASSNPYNVTISVRSNN